MKPRFLQISSRCNGIQLTPQSLREAIKARREKRIVPVEIWINEGNRRWPEAWSSEGVLIVRDDVAKCLDQEQLGGIFWTNVSIAWNGSKLSLDEMPSYRCLIPEEGLGIDPDWIAGVDRRFLKAPVPAIVPQETRFVPDLKSWSGVDISGCSNFPTNCIWCTTKVIELARRRKWKDFRFYPMDLPYFAASKFNKFAGVDYRGKKWPPDWYPEGCEGVPANLEPEL